MTGKYKQAGTEFALSNLNFETVAIKFITYKQNLGLLNYLECVLNTYKLSKITPDSDKYNDTFVQKCCLCTWIILIR